MKDKYVYPAVFNYAEDGITITFPDLQDALVVVTMMKKLYIWQKKC